MLAPERVILDKVSLYIQLNIDGSPLSSSVFEPCALHLELLQVAMNESCLPPGRVLYGGTVCDPVRFVFGFYERRSTSLCLLGGTECDPVRCAAVTCLRKVWRHNM